MRYRATEGDGNFSAPIKIPGEGISGKTKGIEESDPAHILLGAVQGVPIVCFH